MYYLCICYKLTNSAAHVTGAVNIGLTASVYQFLSGSVGFYFFRPVTDTFAFSTGRYQVPIRYQGIIIKLYASLSGRERDHSCMVRQY